MIGLSVTLLIFAFRSGASKNLELNLTNFVFIFCGICFVCSKVIMTVSYYQVNFLLALSSMVVIVQGTVQVVLLASVQNFIWVDNESICWSLYYCLFASNVSASIYDFWGYTQYE